MRVPIPLRGIVGMVVALRGGGIVLPTLRDADSRSLDDLMDELRDVVARARTGRLRTAELSDATLTVTSLGDGGVDTIYGVIYPPQVAIVGFGSVREQPWAEHGLLGSRPILHATLAADHSCPHSLSLTSANERSSPASRRVYRCRHGW